MFINFNQSSKLTMMSADTSVDMAISRLMDPNESTEEFSCLDGKTGLVSTFILQLNRMK